MAVALGGLDASSLRRNLSASGAAAPLSESSRDSAVWPCFQVAGGVVLRPAPSAVGPFLLLSGFLRFFLDFLGILRSKFAPRHTCV